MKIPKRQSNDWREEYLCSDIDQFIQSLNKIDNVVDKKLFLHNKTISQNKLRDAGFQIVRDVTKADVVVILDPSKIFYSKGGGYGNRQAIYLYNIGFTRNYFDILSSYPDNINYLFDHELYKYLYKYEGNYELYSQINDLLESKDSSNIQIAMEFMANANWNNNDIYLHKLFNDYWSYIASNKYRSSISFKGFLSSLDFEYDSLNYYDADSYRDLCKTDEHHNFIFELYKEDFQSQLDELLKTHKIKIKTLEYEIDKS